MILGTICTRRCAFCAVSSGKPDAVDPLEPGRVSRAVYQLGILHVVITSVTRDDLADGGAAQFARTIEAVRKENHDATIEVLTPDFQNCQEQALTRIGEEGPDVINHNLETVPRLYPSIRSLADYRLSLALLESAAGRFNNILTKSGLMLGLGETQKEVLQVFEDLRKADCRLLTLGQYLRPHSQAVPVREFIPPNVFEKYREIAQRMGFDYVESGPYVRSSFHAQSSFFAARSLMGGQSSRKGS